ncbi:hypothetical protein ASPZODRAFT_168566 [Penicilliopsis zonata CBS 506.65]|uniref:CBF1-interacting co-repressor CIR N-terminal domain-containing protein n=1 Tax=Penicilliopsis zonata CBS 506.65 TaxID=1073090 RepID=A0A1L9SAQ7_9EURO|nr:hypothetical protein ASPZODRAFT_168566 [Penicilliopsis zonata CBS 506.65]OJJ44270.1 hypothetical protein ASPZODRAFT_168566 [Penicilliopsis zonata CBS 506.65]
MPLHLLGKKSWNVYNQENIARVRRDEAQAKAREEEAERRMQEEDAERRIQILRGEQPSPLPPPPSPGETSTRQERRRDRDDIGRSRKRRRLAGEDDTDRDIRFAREDAAEASARREQMVSSSTMTTTTTRGEKDLDTPLTDSTGHINLFASEAAQQQKQKPVEKNAEAEAEAARKKRQYEDQYTMRFSNAAGFRESVGQSPWYSSSSHGGQAPQPMSEKDVWGNEDPLRKERERARLDSNDPLAAMKKGVRQLQAVEKARKQWNEDRLIEMKRLQTDAYSDQHRSSRQHRRRRERSRPREPDSDGSLENFKLDEASSLDKEKDDDERHRRSSKRSSHHRHRHHRHSSDRRHEHSRSRSHRHSGDGGRESHRDTHKTTNNIL